MQNRGLKANETHLFGGPRTSSRAQAGHPLLCPACGFSFKLEGLECGSNGSVGLGFSGRQVIVIANMESWPVTWHQVSTTVSPSAWLSCWCTNNDDDYHRHHHCQNYRYPKLSSATDSATTCYCCFLTFRQQNPFANSKVPGPSQSSHRDSSGRH